MTRVAQAAARVIGALREELDERTRLNDEFERRLLILSDQVATLKKELAKEPPEPKVTKTALMAPTVLRRRDTGLGRSLYLMNSQEKGWSSSARSVESISQLLEQYDVAIGAWDKDEHSEFAPVIPLPRGEK